MTIGKKRAGIDQIGMVTADLDRSVRTWTAMFGIGPWQVYRNVQLAGTYRGQDAPVTMDVALGYRGTTQVEFIQVKSAGPCPYLGADGQPLEGLHHVAWIVDDLDAEAGALEAEGLVPVFIAGNAAVRVIYLEDPGQPGILYELISGEGSRAQHDAGQTQARDWNGTDTLPEIDFAAFG